MQNKLAPRENHIQFLYYFGYGWSLVVQEAGEQNIN